MTEYLSLAFLVDPFDSVPPALVVSSGDDARSEVSLAEIGCYASPLITYDAWRLVDLLRRVRCPLPRRLIDIGDALRLQSGLSRDQGGERHWSVWSATRDSFDAPRDADVLESLIEAKTVWPTRSEVLRLLASAAGGIRRAWPKIYTGLRQSGEEIRFVDVEVPVQQIFLSRQHAGIQTDKNEIERLLDTVRMEKYSAYRKVATVLGFAPESLTFRNVGPFLARTDARHLAEFSDGSIEEHFKMAQEQSSFARSFLSYMRAKRNLAILTRASGSEARLHPVFSCFGTVTGRILVAEPRIQELRRRYRGILCADQGKELRYLDYAQFEPGILADRARDETFLRQYNSSDLYKSLSRAVFADIDHRAVCKRIFLAYCYGMTAENIAKLLAGPQFNLEALIRFRDAVSGFFGAFPGLEVYRRSVTEELERTGSIGTLLGNRRIRLSTGPLDNKERRWAISQSIQGSASLIFKQAMIQLAKRFGNDSILVPMHDAVLMQFDRREVGSAEAVAKGIMAAVFQAHCPSIQPRVVSASFVEEAPSALAPG
jgi:hypothetical protein